jgi:glycolate oxidase FAD binding subunit
VLPAPEAVGTIVIPGLDADAAVVALSAALGSPYGVSGAAWLPAEAASRLPPNRCRPLDHADPD